MQRLIWRGGNKGELLYPEGWRTNMQVLGIIMAVVGIALIITGKGMVKYLPPDYVEESDDGFKLLLIHMGKLLTGAGGVFLFLGVVLIIRGCL